ncbi:SIS domain-containing protein [Pseudoalteromonas sp. 2CM28B]|uniref:KpsF/GutQ family sugar-phosphate isomerase n=1 Tax=Pseudoalteromonas sp. 2CM28B TaxID=2929851 RepID=UPI0020BEFDC9|nr:KpsF/GutQ family sugar-phosphate isomerase [Pseudoalteromonas sp. 2CM28B]MCK8137773.1 KpsF/GutQ family sugar-phosphate isomerase [Pseudoalteromonas sp. 2CM28B]
MNVINIAQEVIQTEIESLAFMSTRIDESFTLAVDVILNSTGRTIICGMGKSGIIGKKIAASFASTGTPSFFMHPGEAFHGDLGMVKPEDIFIAISNSGETDEVLKLLPFLRNNGNFVIAITSNMESTLSRNAQCHLDIAVPREACKLQLAPTSSTTATLVMGDALTVALMEKRKFQPEHFARFHPGGSLGKRLLSKVKDVMVTQNLPIISQDDSLIDVIHTISSGKLGLALVVDNGSVISIITDGDLRRTIERYEKSAFDLKARDFAKLKPLSISEDTGVDQAFQFMDEKGVNALVVYNAGKLVGVIRK